MTAIDELRAARKVLADTLDDATPGPWRQVYGLNAFGAEDGWHYIASRALGGEPGEDDIVVDTRMVEDAPLIVLLVNLAPTLLTILDDAIDGYGPEGELNMWRADAALRIARQINGTP